MIILAVVLGAVLVAIGFGAVVVRRRLLRGSLPYINGRLEALGLRAPAEIARDGFGVPHVDAASMEDAAFAMGLVHAQDRLWQMELTRRVAAGRISEFAGKEGLQADRLVRRVGLFRVAREEAALLGLEAKQMLEAYAAGVNSVINSERPLPLEFRLLHLRPEPWQPVHSIAAGKLLAFALSLNWEAEMQRLSLLRALGPERAAQLDLTYPGANPTIIAESVAEIGAATGDAVRDMFLEAARWIPLTVGASNSWVVSGARTVSGRPLLCNDPHLTPSVPSTWYAAHVRAGDDFESTGVTTPGLPFVLIGHNRHVAWGFTNSFADCQDLVIEEFDSASAQHYRTERGFEPARLIREIIHVKDASDELEEVVVTRHGPVIGRVDDPARNVWRGLALQWTALTPGGASESMLRLQRAADWRSFREALAPIDAPSQNAVYADDQGHIGYFLCGRIPKRRRLPSGLPVPGWTGDATWERFLAVDEVPQLLDPPDGIIVTANNRIVGDDFPEYIGSDYMNGYRALRITEILAAELAMDREMMAAAQMDVVCPPARDVIRMLHRLSFAHPAAERWRRLLVSWDARMLPDRKEPTVYEAFMRRLAEHALRPLAGEYWGLASGDALTHAIFDYPVNLAGRVTPWLLERWESGDESLFDGTATWAEVAGRAMDDALGDLRKTLGRWRWSWGRAHALPLVHPIGRRRPLGLIFNAGRIPVGGSLDTVLATGYLPTHPFATRLLAPSWRQVIDVGEWEGCTGIHYPGESGQPGSKHYRDLVKRWKVNRQFPLFWSADAVRRNARSRLILQPAPLAESAPAHAEAA